MLFEVIGVGILNDTANLNVRKSERLGKIFKLSGLSDHLFENLPVEVCDRTVRPYGTGVYVYNIVISLGERDFNVRILASLLRQDLDAIVAIFMGGTAIVVAVNLAVENDRGSSGRVRLARHLQFFGRHRLESHARRNERGETE